MADILKAIPSTTPSTQAVGRGDGSRGGEFNSAETPAGTPATFADVLKSLGSKTVTRTGKTLAEQLPLPDTAAASTTADPAAAAAPVAASLFPLPAPDAPLGVAAEPALAATVAALADVDAEAEPALPAAPQPEPAALPLVVAASVLPAAPMIAGETARAVASAPTLSAPGLPVVADTRDARKGQPQAGRGAAIPAADNVRRPDKLAVDAAITAEPDRTGARTASLEHEPGDFRAVIERVANNPAGFGVQASDARTSTARIPDLPVATHFGRAGWQDEVGQKLTWMAGTSRQQADLVLNPPQLGRIEVTMRFEGDQLSASFASPHAAVRETLENSMVRLREVLADAGITLAHTHVGADSRHDSKSMHPGQQDRPADRGNAQLATLPGAEIEIAPTWRSGNGRGMVDLFA
ncbi:MAG: flagellar hook-length control protein FliK [Rhodocyclales bacterium]|nr:flagellar hook-length control protein FliK [Rhodocyclales bacterium]